MMIDPKQILELCEKASKGPWSVKTNRHPESTGEQWGWIEGPRDNWTWSGRRLRSREDAEFIAAARTALPELAAEVISLREIERAARELIEKIGQEHADCAPDPTIFPYEIKLRQALSSPHPGDKLLERVNMLEAERDAAIEDIERLCTTYYEHADDYDLLVNTCGEYCVHENKNLCFEADASEIYRCVNFKWRGLTQAKEAAYEDK